MKILYIKTKSKTINKKRRCNAQTKQLLYLMLHLDPHLQASSSQTWSTLICPRTRLVTETLRQYPPPCAFPSDALAPVSLRHECCTWDTVVAGRCSRVGGRAEPPRIRTPAGNTAGSPKNPSSEDPRKKMGQCKSLVNDGSEIFISTATFQRREKKEKKRKKAESKSVSGTR